MTRAVFFSMILAACSVNHPAEPKVLRPKPTGPLLHGTLVGPDELAARRPDLQITKISDRETLVCLDAETSCVCFTPLACGDGHCTFDEDVRQFKKELGRDTHPVSCETAETARWCQFRTFNFEGDIYRWERRWYDEAGAFVGQSNSTDYDAYCDGRAGTQWIGKMPDCAMPETYQIEPICSDGERKPGALNPPMHWFAR